MATQLAEVAKKDSEKHAWFAIDEHTDYRVRLVQAFVQKLATSFTLGAEVVSLHRVGARKSRHTHTFPKTTTVPHEKMYEPHIKTTALIQTTGEAQFTDDLPILPGSAHALMVPMPFANAIFRGLDISKAQSELGADFLGILTEGKLREAKLPTVIDWRKACGEFQGPFAAKKEECDEPVFLAAGERSHYAGIFAQWLIILSSQLCRLLPSSTLHSRLTSPSFGAQVSLWLSCYASQPAPLFAPLSSSSFWGLRSSRRAFAWTSWRHKCLRVFRPLSVSIPHKISLLHVDLTDHVRPPRHLRQACRNDTHAGQAPG
jgi:hypothetical protein